MRWDAGNFLVRHYSPMRISLFLSVIHKLMLVVVLSLCFTFTAYASSLQALSGRWYQVPANTQFTLSLFSQDSHFKPIDKLALTGGHYVYESSFRVAHNEPIVVDFKNASVLGKFHHYILDNSGTLIAEAQGGIQIKANNPFLLRHARVFNLPLGQYTLVTELESPYFIAQPQPYTDTLSHYQQSIKWGDVIALVSLGVLFSLGVYYSILACVRRRTAEITYAVFILMNFVFNSMTMLLAPDLLGVHWFYLAGAPILISNIAYMFFVMSLLEIKAQTHRYLYRVGRIILAAQGLFLLLAFVLPHWLLEFARYGVGLMLCYGLVAGITRAREGNAIARMYLFAIIAFGAIGSFTILSNNLDGVYTIYIEHLGLLAVTVEVLLIGLVLGYQFADLHREKDQNLKLLQHSLKIAHSDALTGLPNRYALDEALAKLPADGALTFIDMDNLKLYNDHYGHSKGDELLCGFGEAMMAQLHGVGVLHRIGGDEFAITSEYIDSDAVKKHIENAIEVLHEQGFTSAGASHGTVLMYEANNINELKEMADTRMYQNKRSRKLNKLQINVSGI